MLDNLRNQGGSDGRSALNVKSECLVTSGSKASGRDHRSVLAKELVMGPMNPTFQGTTSSI